MGKAKLGLWLFARTKPTNGMITTMLPKKLNSRIGLSNKKSLWKMRDLKQSYNGFDWRRY